jgi:hypothetical protein
MNSGSAAQRMAAAVSVYFDRQVIVVTVLGFSAGLPLALTTSTRLFWMTDVGVDLTTVGLYALVGLPYTLKFLWAPFVDAWRVPVLSRLLGRRRGWLFSTQLLLVVAIVLLGGLDPLKSPLLIAFAAMFVAAVSATQDIVIDAYRVESLGPDQQAAGVGTHRARHGGGAGRAGTLAAGNCRAGDGGGCPSGRPAPGGGHQGARRHVPHADGSGGAPVRAAVPLHRRLRRHHDRAVRRRHRL